MPRVGVVVRRRARALHAAGRAAAGDLAGRGEYCGQPRITVTISKPAAWQAELHHTRLSAAACGAVQPVHATRYESNHRDLHLTRPGGEKAQESADCFSAVWRQVLALEAMVLCGVAEAPQRLGALPRPRILNTRAGRGGRLVF